MKKLRSICVALFVYSIQCSCVDDNKVKTETIKTIEEHTKSDSIDLQVAEEDTFQLKHILGVAEKYMFIEPTVSDEKCASNVNLRLQTYEEKGCTFKIKLDKTRRVKTVSLLPQNGILGYSLNYFYNFKDTFIVVAAKNLSHETKKGLIFRYNQIYYFIGFSQYDNTTFKKVYNVSTIMKLDKNFNPIIELGLRDGKVLYLGGIKYNNGEAIGEIICLNVLDGKLQVSTNTLIKDIVILFDMPEYFECLGKLEFNMKQENRSLPYWVWRSKQVFKW
jgi:hypothetical protein